jgi:hypothetical protein
MADAIVIVPRVPAGARRPSTRAGPTTTTNVPSSAIGTGPETIRSVPDYAGIFNPSDRTHS